MYEWWGVGGVRLSKRKRDRKKFRRFDDELFNAVLLFAGIFFIVNTYS